MTPISIYLTLYQLAVLHGNQIFHKALYAHIGSEVMISCQISKETSTKSWRKGLTLVTLGLEINRDVRGYRRLEVTIEEGFYNLRINNITEYDFSTYWCETQQGKSVITQGTKLIHLDRQMMSHRTTLSDSSETKDSTYRQRTSFQSTLSDSFTTEIKDGTGMHAGNRLFNGLFVTGFVLLCLSICGNCFFNKVNGAFIRRRKIVVQMTKKKQDLLQGNDTKTDTASAQL